MPKRDMCAACANQPGDCNCRSGSPPEDEPYFRTVVFEPVDTDDEDFAQSQPVKLPERTDRATAWQRLMNALRGNRSLRGGTVQESGWRPWG
jgi:hypothetical protein